MHRVFQQIPLFVQKAEVHAPGIHADAVHASISLCFDQSLLDLMEETQHIPVHRTVYYDRIIGKTVYFLCRDLIPVKGSQHDPAAGSAKVHCKDFRFFFGYIHSVSSVFIQRSVCLACSEVLALFIHAESIPCCRTEYLFFRNVVHSNRNS